MAKDERAEAWVEAAIAAAERLAAGDWGARFPVPDEGDEATARLAAALNRMAAQVESACRAQERVVADAAHELRTPLTALQGALEVLLRGGWDDPASARRLTQSMYREVGRLSRLVEQLLGLSQVQRAGAVHPRPLDLPAFFEGFMASARFLAAERRLVLRSGEPVMLNADPDALRQILFNLLDNAVQHTGEGGQIEVGWEVSPTAVVLFVADDGEGIAPDDLPHIFEPFYRGDRSRSRRRGGTGLGLALVKALAEAHAGRVEAQSTPGEGARFRVVLPAP